MTPTIGAHPLTEYLNVSRETSARLSAYEALLRQWNPRINLVAPSTLDVFGSRHIQDSLQLVGCLKGDENVWVDFGSGGGLPGLPVAILAAETHPLLRVTLVESDKRKAAFLSEAVRHLQLNVRVLNSRIEDLTPLKAQIVSARAVAELDRLLTWASPHLAPTGICIFPKGRDWQRELENAKRHWLFECALISSKTDDGAAILVITELARV